MSRFTLVVRPDGQAILAARGDLDVRQVVELREALRAWEAQDFRTLVLADCDVVQMRDVEIEFVDPVEAAG